ncbi:MAG: hypothetical protein ABIZ49_03325 [Opitutaceae bacterium]
MNPALRAVRCILVFTLAASALHAAPPPALARALEYLRDQRSYSWEMINSDPGPVTQTVPTRRGTVTRVQQSTTPHIKGSVDFRGDSLIERDWPDGVRLDTLIAADGKMVTNTPEGWLTNQDVLNALAEERVRANPSAIRLLWLQRSDRPNIRRPDEELVPLLNSNDKFEEVSPNSFVTRGRIGVDPSRKADEGDSQEGLDLAITMNLRGGMIRDYEIDIQGTRRAPRGRAPLLVNDHRIVVLTYVGMAKVPAPPEAREKLKLATR